MVVAVPAAFNPVGDVQEIEVTGPETRLAPEAVVAKEMAALTEPT